MVEPARKPTASRSPGRAGRLTGTWPAYAIAVGVGAFCLVVGVAWVLDHVVGITPVDETAAIIAVATLLRVLTILLALASVRGWWRRLPDRLMSPALWGCAAAQLAYPVAELLVKLTILTGAIELPPAGVGNMSPQGWFSLAAAGTVFGIPGFLFVLAAISHANRHRLRSRRLPVLGSLAGIAALGLLGLAIG